MNRQRFDEIKGLLRRLESLLEIVLLALVYYYVWRHMFYNSRFLHFVSRFPDLEGRYAEHARLYRQDAGSGRKALFCL